MKSPWDASSAAQAERAAKDAQMQAIVDIADLIVNRKFKNKQAIDILAQILGSLIVSQVKPEYLDEAKAYVHALLDAYMERRA